MPESIFLVRNLCKGYFEGEHRVSVLNELQLTVEKGESIAVMGASGVGKSTLLHLLGGLEQPDAGEIFVAGEPVHKLSPDELAALRNRYLGFVYQFHHLLPEFTALENVAMPLLIRREKKAKALKESQVLLDLLGLASRMAHKPSELSGGERQRVAIARALVGQPLCVLMDEPTGNLDQETAGQIIDLLRRLNREMGVAFLIATHSDQLAGAMQQVQRLSRGALQQVLR